ncbi:MAG TPA: oligosaccharide flippase family protein [Chloroflexia bacterium]|nr:oligosaccharide flippase family protein [Chloroflexia bacterium]
MSNNLAFQALNVISTFLLLSIGSMVNARYLGLSQMGEYGILTTLSSALINTGALGLTDAASRFVAEYASRGERRKMLGFIRFGLLGVLLIALVTTFGLYYFAEPLSTLLGLDGAARYLVLTGLVVAPAMLGNMLTSILAGLQRYDLIAIVKVCTNLPLIAMSLLVLQLKFGITGLLLVNITANSVAFLLWLILVLRLIPLFKEDYSFSWRDVWRVVAYSFSMLVIALITIIVWQRSGVFFLSIYRNSREVGLYVTAFVLSSVFTTVITNILHVMIPAFAELIGKGDVTAIASLFRTSARITALLAVPIAFGGMLIAKELIWLLYGTQYLDATPILQILMIATLASIISTGCNFTITSTAPNNRLYLVVMIGLSLINLSLNFLLVPVFGVVGAALCHATTQFLTPFCFDRLLRHLHGFGYPAYNVGLIISVGLVSLLIAMLGHYLIEGWLGTAGAVLIFAGLYLPGVVFVRAIYRRDLHIILRFMCQLHLPPILIKPLESVTGWLKEEN